MIIVVSNSSPLVLLAKIGDIEILRDLYKKVLIPEAVYSEVIVKGKGENYSDAFVIENGIDHYIFVKKLESKYYGQRNKMAEIYGLGEIEAILLCVQEKADLLLADNLEARKLAEKNNIKWRSTIGILLEALTKNKIHIEEFEGLVKNLAKYAWLSGDVVAKFLEAGRTLRGGKK